VTYSEPEVASVGLTTAQAKERGHDVVELIYDLAGNGKAQILGTSGSIKLVSEKNGPVLGIHMVGSRVGELLAEAQLIFNWEATAADVCTLWFHLSVREEPQSLRATPGATATPRGRPRFDDDDGGCKKKKETIDECFLDIFYTERNLLFFRHFLLEVNLIQKNENIVK
jgi:hypothetical protein